MPPDSHEVVVKPARASSAVWKYGVKLKHKTSGKWSFKCLGSPACRGNSIFIGISKDAASNATDHIKEKHNAGDLMLPSSPQTSVCSISHLDLCLRHTAARDLVSKFVYTAVVCSYVYVSSLSFRRTHLACCVCVSSTLHKYILKLIFSFAVDVSAGAMRGRREIILALFL